MSLLESVLDGVSSAEEFGIGNSNVNEEDLFHQHVKSREIQSVYALLDESGARMGTVSVVPAAEMRTTVAVCSAALTLSRRDTTTSVL